VELSASRISIAAVENSTVRAALSAYLRENGLSLPGQRLVGRRAVDSISAVEHPRELVRLVQRLAALVLTLGLLAGNAAICAGWISESRRRSPSSSIRLGCLCLSKGIVDHDQVPVAGGDRLHASGRLNVQHGASESHDADVHAAIHAADALSTRVENHAAAIALYVMYYNFGHNRQTLRLTPAMEAGIATHVWTVDESSVCSDTKV
jgi:hypothetical protein